MPFSIRYYRSPYWAARYRRAGIHKPAGMVTSPYAYAMEHHAREVAAAINAALPEEPCTVVRVLCERRAKGHEIQRHSGR